MSGEHLENGVEEQNGTVVDRPPTNWVDYAEDRYVSLVQCLVLILVGSKSYLSLLVNVGINYRGGAFQWT